MSDADALLSDVQRVLGRAPTSRRVAILHDITELFLDGAGLYSKEQIAIFGSVLIALTEESEQEELIELATRLAPIATAPPALMRKLASNPDLKVSAMLLLQCAALTDSDLAEIAPTATVAQLMVMASRPEASETLTDALINRGEIEVIRKCISNERARVSHVGFVKLINAAKRDGTLTDMVATHKDLPDELRPFIGMLRSQAAAGGKQAATA